MVKPENGYLKGQLHFKELHKGSQAFIKPGNPRSMSNHSYAWTCPTTWSSRNGRFSFQNIAAVRFNVCS